MIQRPNFISNQDVISKIKDFYEINISSLKFLPVGEASWCFVAQSNNGELFIKLTKDSLYAPSVTIPSFIYNDLHLPFVTAAIPTVNCHWWLSIKEHDLIIYQYVKGKTVMDSSLQENQWIQIGEIFEQLHTIQLPKDIIFQLRKETFIPQQLEGANKAIDYARSDNLSGIDLELAKFIKDKEEEIRKIIARTVALGQILQAQRCELVVCHAYPNEANLMITHDNNILVIDWDGVMLAPRERDLMFFTAPRQKAFFKGYNKTNPYKINYTAIAYYKYEWVVQEFNDYGTRIFFSDLDDVMKQHALESFKELFKEDNVIDGAYSSEKYLKYNI